MYTPTYQNGWPVVSPYDQLADLPAWTNELAKTLDQRAGGGVFDGLAATWTALPTLAWDARKLYLVADTATAAWWDGTQWIKTTALTGPQGPAGPAGPQGPQGPTGPAGTVAFAGTGTATTAARSDHDHNAGVEVLRTTSTAVSLPDGQAVKIDWNAGTGHASLAYDSTNKRLSVSTAGLYLVSATARGDSTGNANWYIRIQINGTTIVAPAGKAGSGLAYARAFKLKAGDTISTELANFTGGTLTLAIAADVTTLSVVKIG